MMTVKDVQFQGYIDDSTKLNENFRILQVTIAAKESRYRPINIQVHYNKFTTLTNSISADVTLENVLGRMPTKYRAVIQIQFYALIK